ncbi:MAG: hypothetical protein DPW09_40310 [Anaerolineae bacterium]|nr:hypothetical protein [Anaerolineales bacterium]MCQ3979704.1 hypothetical protein [Anaerolineae bacterium]
MLGMQERARLQTGEVHFHGTPGQGTTVTVRLPLDAASDRPRHETLSDREFQVMQLMASGKTLAEIAEELSLSAKTVSTYRTRLMEKLDLKSNAELMRYAIENRLIE